MIEARNERISIRQLTQDYRARRISGDDFIQAISESYAYNEQVDVILNPRTGVITVAYNPDSRPTLHEKLTTAGWKSDGILIDKHQTPESTDRTQESRNAIYRLKPKKRRTMFSRLSG